MSLLKKKNHLVWNTVSPLQKKHRLSDAAYYSLIAALLGAMLMYLIYLLQSQTIAGGDRTVLRMDLYHQYGPLYAELYDRLTSGESLLYSWNSGLGSSFLGNLYNYCCSPFTLLILFFGHKNIPEAIAVIILLKATAASASFTYFINRSFVSRKTSIAFGLLYAFSGYFVAYSWNLMWLDAFLIFPLVMLGIEQIIKRGKPALYIATLTYTMITNYYMAYMVCILSVLYFVFFYCSRYKFGDKLNADLGTITTDANGVVHSGGVVDTLRNSRFFAAGVRFALGSFLAFLLSAFALLPVFFILKSSSATSSSGPPAIAEWKEYFNIFDFLANHLADLEPTIRSSGSDVLPNIYCGVMTILLIPAFLFNSKISRRRKICSVIFLVVFYAGFCLNFFNFIWHGMHYPNDLPYRFSFAYSFLLLMLAYEAFLHIRELSWKFYLGTGIGLLGFIVLLQKFDSKNIGDYTLMVNILFVAVYVVALCLLASKKLRRDTVVMLMVCTVMAELLVSDSTNFVMSQDKEAYVSDYDDFQEISAVIDNYEATAGDQELFFREERSRLLTRMDACWLDYNGISVFSSMASEAVSKLHRQFGLFSNGINSYTYNPQTAIYNSMFAIKYITDKEDLLKTDSMYTLIPDETNGANQFKAYEYNWYLPLAFCVDDTMEYWADTGSTNPFENQNNYFEAATGVSAVLTPLTPEEDVDASGSLSVNDYSLSSGSYTYTASEDEGTATITVIAPKAGQVCIYFKSPDCIGYNITADNDFKCSTRYSTGSMTYYSVNVGELQEGEKVNVAITYDGDNASGTAYFYAVMLDEEKFAEGYNTILDNGTINITAFEETYLEGTVDVARDDTILYTSIPYDKSWVVRLNGDIVPEENIIKVGDAMLAIRIGKGDAQKVSFTYEAQGLQIGIYMTIAGVLLTVFILLLSLLRKRKLGDAQSPLLFFPMDTEEDDLVPDDDDDFVSEQQGYVEKNTFPRVFFSYLTFGILYLVWKWTLYTDIKAFAEKYGNWVEKSTVPVCLYLVPFYNVYWVWSRSRRIAASAREQGINMESNFTVRAILTLFLSGALAYGELQEDLNFFYRYIDRVDDAEKEQFQKTLHGYVDDNFEDIAMQPSLDQTDPLNAGTEYFASAMEGTEEEPSEPSAAEQPVSESAPAYLFTRKGTKYGQRLALLISLLALLCYFVLFYVFASYVEKSSEEETTTAAPITVTQTTSTTAESSLETTQTTTTEAPTEAPTEPETSVLDSSLIADAARGILAFSGIELGDDSMILFVGASSKEGDTLLSVCERYGVNYDEFAEVLMTLNTVSSPDTVLNTGTKLILPMRVSEEATEAEFSVDGESTVG